MIFLEHKNKFLGDWVATFMMYLSPVDEGGATVFPRLGLRVSPEVGSALFWYRLIIMSSSIKHKMYSEGTT